MVKYHKVRVRTRLLWFLCHQEAYRQAIILDCDVYHFHDPSFFYFAKKLKRKGKKVIFDCHETRYKDICYDLAPNKGIITRLSSKRYDFYEHHIARMVDAIIVVTPQMVEYMSRFNKNVYLITNYPKKREQLAITRKNQIVFAGGISKLWNHEKIIEAISTMDTVRYCLCGKDAFGYINELKKHTGWDKVDYYGCLSHEDVMVKLSESMIGVAISVYRKNTFGKEGTLGNTKIFEEMQAGLPVICTDFDLWKEIVEKHNCGICVNPNSISEIREAIEYLLTHPKEALEMGERGRIAVEISYNWEKEEPKLLELYKIIY